jgi:hypothetical protein
MTTCGHCCLRLVNLDDNPINECNIALKLWDMLIKGSLFFDRRPSNLMTYGLINVGCMDNFIVTCNFVQFHKNVPYILTFSHV